MIWPAAHWLLRRPTEGCYLAASQPDSAELASAAVTAETGSSSAESGCDDPRYPPALAAFGVGVLLVGAAFGSRHFPRAARPPPRRPRPRSLGVVAFVCTGAHFVLVYAVPSTGLPWVVGLIVALTPIVVGVLCVRRWAGSEPPGCEGLWVVTGILSFFLLLDAFVGLGGRYDLSASAVLTALGLAWVHRRVCVAGESG